MSALSLTYAEFRSLLAPVVPLAGTDDMRPVLQRVAIAASGDHLIAQATNLVVAGFKRVVPSEPAGDFRVVLAATDVRQALDALTPRHGDADRARVILDVDDETGSTSLYAHAPGGLARGYYAATLVFDPIEAGPAFPDLSTLLPGISDREPIVVPTTGHVREVGINPTELARFRAAQELDRRSPMRLYMPADHRQPVAITIGQDFAGTIAPQRALSPTAADVLASWRGTVPVSGIGEVRL